MEGKLAELWEREGESRLIAIPQPQHKPSPLDTPTSQERGGITYKSNKIRLSSRKKDKEKGRSKEVHESASGRASDGEVEKVPSPRDSSDDEATDVTETP